VPLLSSAQNRALVLTTIFYVQYLKSVQISGIVFIFTINIKSLIMISKISFTILICLAVLGACTNTSDKAPGHTGDSQIDDLIASMSLEEKVGQMTNLTLATIAEEKEHKIILDSAKAYDIIVNHHIGSIQNVISQAYHLNEWHDLINRLQKMTLEQTRHKIPFLYCIDAVHGANYIYGATLFPHNLGLGATRNPELVAQCAAITAQETRAAGIRYNFSPVLDVGRNQQWSRFGETFGEDVYLVTELGLASIRGYEGSDLASPASVASCMKHFLGYSVPQNGKDRAPAYIPEGMMREYFLPPFTAAVQAGSQTLMVNSGEVNGVPVHASRYLLTDILRKELNFEGIIITDWLDIVKLHERHRVAASHKEAVYLAVNAGIDMCIVPFDLSFYNDLIELVREKRISEDRINASVKRILLLKKKLGLFENPYIEKEAIENFGKPEYKEAALQAARESITLLKNNNELLPLKNTARVLLTGPSANSAAALHGAWSYSWQGDNEQLYPENSSTIVRSLAPEFKVNFLDCGGFDKLSWNSAELRKQAQNSDVILVCAGEQAYAETPGNINSLDFDPGQVALIRELHQTGKPVVLILTEGRPRILNEIEKYCEAILLTYWSGSEGANAIAEILAGKTNPSGKLPFTYPRYNGALLTYDHKLLDEAVEIVKPEYEYRYEFNPQYPFGHGLSYTTFEYSNLSVSHDTLTGNDTLHIKVTVANTGKVKGKEVIEVYIRDQYASITPPVKRLKRFEKTELAPGETTTREFHITRNDLSFVGAENKWITEEGGFEIKTGPLSGEFYLKN